MFQAPNEFWAAFFCVLVVCPMCLAFWTLFVAGAGMSFVVGKGNNWALTGFVVATVCMLCSSCYTAWAQHRCGEKGCDNVFLGK
jgi:hypothetical protein